MKRIVVQIIAAALIGLAVINFFLLILRIVSTEIFWVIMLIIGGIAFFLIPKLSEKAS